MAFQDLKNKLQFANGISATLSGTTPAKGNIIDTTSFLSNTFFLATGTVTDAGTADGFSTEIQHSDTTADTDFAAVTNTELIGLESALKVTADADDNKVIGSIGYAGNKKYIRAVITGTTGTNAVVSGFWVKGNASIEPPVVGASNISAT